VEAQGLADDGGYATEFDVGAVQEAVAFLQRVAVTGEEDKVGDGLQRIVDLVRDGAGKAADDG